jgi:hypothetical protein
MSYRSLAQHIDNWCSKATIERWLKSHDTYHFFTKKIKPGMTEENKIKQVEFSEFVHRRWGLVIESGELYCKRWLNLDKNVNFPPFHQVEKYYGCKAMKNGGMDWFHAAMRKHVKSSGSTEKRIVLITKSTLQK